MNYKHSNERELAYFNSVQNCRIPQNQREGFVEGWHRAIEFALRNGFTLPVKKCSAKYLTFVDHPNDTSRPWPLKCSLPAGHGGYHKFIGKRGIKFALVVED
jgi:hypothetical protein